MMQVGILNAFGRLVILTVYAIDNGEFAKCLDEITKLNFSFRTLRQ